VKKNRAAFWPWRNGQRPPKHLPDQARHHTRPIRLLGRPKEEGTQGGRTETVTKRIHARSVKTEQKLRDIIDAAIRNLAASGIRSNLEGIITLIDAAHGEGAARQAKELLLAEGWASSGGGRAA